MASSSSSALAPAQGNTMACSQCNEMEADASAQGSALASAQGKRQKRADKTWPEEGIKHLCSVGKEERDKAKHLDKKIKWEEERWAAGRSKMTRQAWDDLVAQRASQWDHAENISFLARFPFKDRNGVMQCTEPIDLVLRRWCVEQMVVYV